MSRCSWYASLCFQLLLATAVLGGSKPAAATTFGFDCITNEKAGDCAIGESQLHLDVTSPGPEQIQFQLTNTGPAQSTIAGVYFGARLLGAISSISSAGVSFSADGSPPGLPGGQSISPAFSTDFRVNAKPAPPKNGVNPGDSLDVVFDLDAGVSAADVIAALDSGALRVGLHVINFASGGSESFVCAVPEPSTLLLLASGVAALRSMRRRARSSE